MRGKRRDATDGVGADGLIPACAGKTSGRFAEHPRAWAHPRVCGENVAPICPMRSSRGSSPRVRGKHAGGAGGELQRGLIPACAGKTDNLYRFRRYHWAHPRVCGENWCVCIWVRVVSGSSPRVRGKPEKLPLVAYRKRLIPACAGKTWKGRVPSRRSRAHPRVCGENRIRERNIHVQTGSSPRVRGKQQPEKNHDEAPGLIPACAGKTG